MTTLVHQRVEAARQGQNPTVICRMPSGWLVLGDVQMVHGACLLLPDPVVPSLNDLDEAGRTAYLGDMARAGDALMEVTGAWRINYEILGNYVPVLHAYIIPRYLTEPDESRERPVWFYDLDAAPRFDAQRDRPLMDQLATAIKKRI